MRSQVFRALQLAQRGVASAEAAAPALNAAVQRVLTAAAPSAEAQRQVSTSAASSSSAVAAALSDAVSNSSTPQDLADAAVALAVLRAGTAVADPALRRAMGVTLQQAVELKAAFDAASLATLLHGITQAGVEHRRTLYELSAPAQKLAGSFTPQQVGWVAEAFGKAGVDNVALFDALTAKVTAGLAQYKPADLAAVLYGIAGAGYTNVKATTTITAQLAAAADQLTIADTAKATWALATAGRADKATLDAILKPAAGKLGKGEAAADVAAIVWAAATLGYPAGPLTGKAAATLKAGASKLTAGQAISGAWGLAVLGSADTAAVSALFGTAASAVAAAPDSVPFADLARLYEASALVPTATLPAPTAKFAEYAYSLVQERRKLTTPKAVLDFKAALATATATALGAQFRPEVEARLAAFPTAVTPALVADIAFTSGANKVVVEGVAASEMTAGTPAGPLGAVTARAKVAAAAGYKVVLVPEPEFAAAADKAKYVAGKLRKEAGV